MSEMNGTVGQGRGWETLDDVSGIDTLAVRGAKAGRRAPRRKAEAVQAATTAKLRAAVGGRDMVRRYLTVGMGCGVPCLSLALSSIGGRLWVEGHGVLGGAALVLCCSVLAVSLSHLAWAVRDITRSAWWQAWCLAVAVDCSLVLGELAGISGYSSWVVSAVMVSVTVCSAVLNCWAFLRHGR